MAPSTLHPAAAGVVTRWVETTSTASAPSECALDARAGRLVGRGTRRQGGDNVASDTATSVYLVSERVQHVRVLSSPGCSVVLLSTLHPGVWCTAHRRVAP